MFLSGSAPRRFTLSLVVATDYVTPSAFRAVLLNVGVFVSPHRHGFLHACLAGGSDSGRPIPDWRYPTFFFIALIQFLWMLILPSPYLSCITTRCPTHPVNPPVVGIALKSPLFMVTSWFPKPYKQESSRGLP